MVFIFFSAFYTMPFRIYSYMVLCYICNPFILKQREITRKQTANKETERLLGEKSKTHKKKLLTETDRASPRIYHSIGNDRMMPHSNISYVKRTLLSSHKCTTIYFIFFCYRPHTHIQLRGVRYATPPQWLWNEPFSMCFDDPGATTRTTTLTAPDLHRHDSLPSDEY